MDDRDVSNDPPYKKGLRDKKTQNSFLPVGIVFIAVGIGLSFGGSSTWIVFLVIGITFVGIAATAMGKKRGTTPKRPPSD